MQKNDNLKNGLINTSEFSQHLRSRGIDVPGKKILVTNFEGSKQEQDLSEPVNCRGFGRVRHFRLGSGERWPVNPLPILPAAKALGISSGSEIRAQVFQNSICNWRCWYCFVDYNLLSGDRKHADFFTCDELLDMYLEQPDPPRMIDLTGGQPDLTPEWVPWMMEALTKRGLQKEIYLWSDDNLSNDYLWRYLSDEQIEMLSTYKMYSRVCCFKGIDPVSFSLNTKADPSLFENQFSLCGRLIQTGIDLYCYITLTANTSTNFANVVPSFFDKIQAINESLPLRIVPLEIVEFSPVKDRMNDNFRDMIQGQYRAMEIWEKELQRRFSSEERSKLITDIKINSLHG